MTRCVFCDAAVRSDALAMAEHIRRRCPRPSEQAIEAANRVFAEAEAEVDRALKARLRDAGPPGPRFTVDREKSNLKLLVFSVDYAPRRRP